MASHLAHVHAHSTVQEGQAVTPRRPDELPTDRVRVGRPPSGTWRPATPGVEDMPTAPLATLPIAPGNGVPPGNAARARWLPMLPMALLALGILVLFWPAEGLFFVGDEFYWLYRGAYVMNGPAGWVQAFTQSNGSGQYRPLTLDVFYWLGWNLFGLHPFAWHLLVLAIFVASALVMYQLLVRMTGSTWIALGAAAIWACSVSHYEGVAWDLAIAETGAVLPAVCCLGAMVGGTYRWMVFWYVVALFCNETTSVLPAMVFVYFVVWERLAVTQALRRSLPLWLTFGAYMVVRLLIPALRPGASGPFALVLDPVVWLRLTWTSLLASLDFSAVLNNVVNYAGPQWHALAGGVVILFLVTVLALVVTAIVGYVRSGEWDSAAARMIALGLLWFALGLAPVLPFANNFSEYNLALALIGVALVFGGLAMAARQAAPHAVPYAGPGLALACGVTFLAMGLLIVNGPGGMTQVDGVAVFSRASEAAYIQMRADEQAHPGPLYVFVDSSQPSIMWALGIENLAQLIAPYPGTTVCYATACAHAPNLRLHFDPATDTITPSP